MEITAKVTHKQMVAVSEIVSPSYLASNNASNTKLFVKLQTHWA